MSVSPIPQRPRQDRPPQNDPGIWRMSRKNFLAAAGWTAVLGSLVLSAAGALRVFFPRVLYELPTTFKAGLPADYAVGEVNERFKEERRVWIVRDIGGLYALSAVCTHLGCTPRWVDAEDKFKCPCHGSGFQRTGVNFEGPAPRPLERLKISLAGDGQILIDTSVRFRYEDGGWTRPDAYLPYPS